MCYKARFCLRFEGDTVEVASKIIEVDDPLQALYIARDITATLMPAFKKQGIASTQVEVHIDKHDPQLALFPGMVQHSGSWTYLPSAPTLATLNTTTKPVVVS